MKFRGYQTDDDTPVLHLLHNHALLHKDGKEQKLDPFMMKIIVQPHK